MNADERRLNLLTEQIIGCAYQVSNTLGSGFLEKVYENALVYELRKTGIHIEQQKGINVFYDGFLVGEFFADMIVENSVIIELKTVKLLDENQLAQCLNYLKAIDLKICLLINFAKPRIEIKRIVNNF